MTVSIRVVAHLCNRRLVESWAESFPFSGSSALLLIVANFFSEYGYFSLFALVPFLYGISRASPSEGLRLGLLFGISFFTVSLLPQLVSSPLLLIVIIIFGSLLFSLFGWLTGWTSKRWGFNPIIVALLWVVVELVMIKMDFVTGMFQEAERTHPVFHGMAALFGFLFVSFVIVLLNSILIWAVVSAALVVSTSCMNIETRKQEYQHIYNASYQLQEVFSIPQERAPPCRSY
jgi:apolipoprotein N-acyltransferase